MIKLKLYFKNAIKVLKRKNKNCPVGKRYNVFSNMCENICAEGYEYNPITKTCDVKEDSEYDFPDNACFIKPNAEGNFTSKMVYDKVSEGCKYLVFDADNLDIHYEETLTFSRGWASYLIINNIKATELEPITLDFRKVYINCFPNAINPLLPHRFITLKNCEFIVTKFGKVDGDKFKRELVTDAEIYTENTQLFQSGEGSLKLTIDGGSAMGFMGDVQETSVFGSANIAGNPLNDEYYLQPDGRYESIFYNVNTELYKDFGLIGQGYTRLQKYDMEDVIFKFYDESEVLISQMVGSYYGRYSFPERTKKIKVNVKFMDGRVENPTGKATHTFVYNPNQGITIKNLDIYDNHRGGLANIGSKGTVEDCNFFTTPNYYTKPQFGVLANASTTLYHLNCEDAVSKDLVIKNCSFKDKFHKILLTHNISADVYNNEFSGGGNNIFIYYLISGNIYNNFFEAKIVSAGQGTSRVGVNVYNNTGSPDVQLTNGAVFYNNTFSNGRLSGIGNMHNNVFNNYSFDFMVHTKNVYDNVFNGSPSPGYLYGGYYLYKNTFNNLLLRMQHPGSKTIFVKDCFFNNTGNLFIERLTVNMDIVLKNTKFDNGKFGHTTLNKTLDYVEGNWYFEDCDFTNMNGNFFTLANNRGINETPLKIYFKNCTFEGVGSFVKRTYNNMNYNFIFDNCTIDSRLVMPTNYTNEAVIIPDEVENRTQPVPQITKEADRSVVRIKTVFHYFDLKIRDKRDNSVQDVYAVTPYFHRNSSEAEADNFEYSIDGGKYWDSVEII